MHFERAHHLVNATPTDVLCAAWGSTREYVTGLKAGVRPMTIREAGSLAEIHGLKLEDVLAV